MALQRTKNLSPPAAGSTGSPAPVSCSSPHCRAMISLGIVDVVHRPIRWSCRGTAAMSPPAAGSTGPAPPGSSYTICMVSCLDCTAALCNLGKRPASVRGIAHNMDPCLGHLAQRRCLLPEKGEQGGRRSSWCQMVLRFDEN